MGVRYRSSVDRSEKSEPDKECSHHASSGVDLLVGQHDDVAMAELSLTVFGVEKECSAGMTRIVVSGLFR
jgi:hypothetical protein